MNTLHGCLFSLIFSPLLLAAPLSPDQSGDEQPSEERPEQPSEEKPEQTPEQTPPVIPTPCKFVSFSSQGWKKRFSSNAYGYPRITENKELELLPDDLYGASSAYLYANNAEPPFEVQFEFNTYDDDGGYGGSYIWHSADGVRFFFLRSYKGYSVPLTGGAMGRSEAAGGFAVSFPTYGRRRAALENQNGKTIRQVSFKNSYSHNKWIPIVVTVGLEQVIVYSGKDRLFSRNVDLSSGKTGNALGFSAATGAADSQHMIRNFCIKQL